MTKETIQFNNQSRQGVKVARSVDEIETYYLLQDSKGGVALVGIESGAPVVERTYATGSKVTCLAHLDKIVLREIDSEFAIVPVHEFTKARAAEHFFI